jgi:hypothetical protein
MVLAAVEKAQAAAPGAVLAAAKAAAGVAAVLAPALVEKHAPE